MRSLGLSVVALSLVLCAGTTAEATFFDVVIPDVDCPVDIPVPVPIEVDTPIWGVSVTDFSINYDPIALKVGHIEYGAGLVAYMAQHGAAQPNFAVVHNNGSIQVQGSLFPTFYASTYGPEFLRITFEATGAVIGATTVTATGWHLSNPSAATMTIATPPPPPEPNFLRGDVNYDSSCNLMDVFGLVQLVFGVSPFPPNCLDTADINDDGNIDISDPVALISSLFGANGPMPEICGPDIQPDSLPTCNYSGCP